MTRTTVNQLLAQRTKLCTSAYNLRFTIKTTKQEMLKMKTNFIEQKILLKNKIRLLKKDLKNLKRSMGLIDNDYHVDPETGIIDMTAPKTPQKPKRVRSKQSKTISKSKRLFKQKKLHM
jgi:hypothetical protein